jgi:two-component system, response regulator
MTELEVEILLVEDNDLDLELTLHALRKEKLANHIKIARDGEEALDFLFAGAEGQSILPPMPKVVLLDLKLPKVDGIEVLRQIKSDPRTKMIPVVILTSSREQQDMINGYGLGANSYIQKPVSFEKFRDVIKNLGMYWLLINEPCPSSRGSIPAQKAS